jgi:PiT family inorganic phosphate transporter
MSDSALLAISPLLLLILAAEFVNGWTDAPNAIATVVSTRVLRPHHAVWMAAILNAAGAFAGTAVAVTIGKGILRTDAIDIHTVAGAMVAIVIWSTVAWYYALPTSESHGLIAGLAGAGLATAGPSVLLWDAWSKVVIGLFFSTVLGFLGAISLMTLILHVCQRWHPSQVRRIFGKLQVLSAALMAFGHGSNDGQKFIGVFALALVLGRVLPDFAVPGWVIVVCAVTMRVGTAAGGWRIISTMGRLTNLEAVHGFVAETAAGLTIQGAAIIGIPLSTTHTISSAIMGVGAVRRLSAVRWALARTVVVGWILTFPICGLIAYVTTLLLRWSG